MSDYAENVMGGGVTSDAPTPEQNAAVAAGAAKLAAMTSAPAPSTRPIQAFDLRRAIFATLRRRGARAQGYAPAGANRAALIASTVTPCAAATSR